MAACRNIGIQRDLLCESEVLAGYSGKQVCFSPKRRKLWFPVSALKGRIYLERLPAYLKGHGSLSDKLTALVDVTCGLRICWEYNTPHNELQLVR